MKLWGNSHFIGPFSILKPNSISAFSEGYSKIQKKALTSTYPVIYNKIPFWGSYNWILNVLEMELRRKPPNACDMLRENIAALRHKLFCTVSGGGVWKQYGFGFQSRYIEHHFEARAKLPPIFDACVTAFLFCRLQLNDRPNGIWFCDDMSETTPLKNRGRNDIRVERCISYVTLLRVETRLSQGYSDLYISFWMLLYGSPNFDRIMRYIGLMRTACLKFLRSAEVLFSKSAFASRRAHWHFAAVRLKVS